MVVFAVILAAAILVIILTMLLRRQLREKYAVLWIVIAILVLVLGFFPGLLSRAAGLLGVVVPANLLFALALVLLVGVALHLSWELSRSEEEVRRLAEEVTILRAQTTRLGERLDTLEGDLDGDAEPLS